MSARLPDAFIDQVLARVDIVDVVQGHVPLRKAGREFVACCPFHSEKTPSFTVSPHKQFYHCFGCGAHGSAIGFLMDHEGLEFREAVEQLARDVGLALPEGDAPPGPAADVLGALRETHERAQAHFEQQLRRHPEAGRAVDYLRSRGLEGRTAARFGLGFAPPGWEHLRSALHDVAQRQLLEAGLLTEGQGGRCYDRFRNRITFPIHDRRGRIIGFGARALDDAKPKYLNSPETPLFHKGQELYGAHLAQRDPAHRQRLFVVEGYMDVVMLAQHGIGNVVATLGTAATPEHLRQLFRMTSEVVFCFDGDAAGERAARRAMETALPRMQGAREVRFMLLPQGQDPDTLVRDGGEAAWHAAVDAALPLSAVLIGTLTEQTRPDTLDGRARIAESARPLLARIPAGAFRTALVNEIANLCRLPAQQVADAPAEAAAVRRRPRPPRAGGVPTLTRQALRLGLNHPEIARDLTPPPDDASTGRRLLLTLIDACAGEVPPTTAQLYERLRQLPGGEYLEPLLARPDITLDAQEARRTLVDIVDKLKNETRRQEKAQELSRRIADGLRRVHDGAGREGSDEI